MKRISKIWLCPIALIMLVGCSEDVTERQESTAESNITETSDEESVSIEEATPSNSQSNEEQLDDKKELQPAYSSQQIEYARIWFQLGPNQEIDELNILHIPAGTPLNAEDETSATYPEDVIQLTGSRLVDGSVTYSGNGDGSINVYNVPLRWDGQYPAGEAFYIDLIENTKKIYVEPNSDERIEALIKLQK